MNLILNERKYAEKIYEQGAFDGKPYDDLGCLVRYFYYIKGKKKSEIYSILEDFLLRCDPNVNLTSWTYYLDKLVGSAEKYKLIELDEIPITYKELKFVDSLDSVQMKRLLFTLICLAKYSNYIGNRDTGWVNRKISEIFALANIAMTNNGKGKMLHKLKELGYITFGKRVDNANIQVLCLYEHDTPCLKITDLRNLGNQYMMYLGQSYFACKRCGLVVKKNGRNHQYCKQCASETAIERAIEFRRSQLSESLKTAN